MYGHLVKFLEVGQSENFSLLPRMYLVQLASCMFVADLNQLRIEKRVFFYSNKRKKWSYGVKIFWISVWDDYYKYRFLKYRYFVYINTYAAKIILFSQHRFTSSLNLLHSQIFRRVLFYFFTVTKFDHH